MSPHPIEAAPPRRGIDARAADPSGDWFGKLRPIAEKIESSWPEYPPAQAPPWVEVALEQVARPIAPREFFDPGPPTVAGLAKMLGWMDSISAIFNDEVPAPPKLVAKLNAAFDAWWRNLPPHRRPKLRDLERHGRRLRRTRHQVQRLVRHALSAAHRRPFVEAQAFLDAYKAGVASISVETLFDDSRLSRNQKLLFTLQSLWPVIPKFASVGEIHRQLTQALGEPKVGDLKNFQRLAGRIGLRLRARGRPRKQK